MLNGKLILAGTFIANGEEITGIVIQIPKETLRDAKTMPLYHQVSVVEKEDLRFRRFAELLIKHGVIDAAAIDSAEGYDNHKTENAVRSAYRDLLNIPES